MSLEYTYIYIYIYIERERERERVGDEIVYWEMTLMVCGLY